MRAIDVHAYLFNPIRPVFEIEDEVPRALLARNFLAEKLAVDAQLAAAMRAMDIVPAQRQLDDRFDLLKRDEFWNLDAVGVEIGVEKSPAIAAMDELFGHLLAAFRTWTTWPRGHLVFL